MFSLDFLHFSLIFDILLKKNVTIALSVSTETSSENRIDISKYTVGQNPNLNPCESFQGLRVILRLLCSLLFHLLS